MPSAALSPQAPPHHRDTANMTAVTHDVRRIEPSPVDRVCIRPLNPPPRSGVACMRSTATRQTPYFLPFNGLRPSTRYMGVKVPFAPPSTRPSWPWRSISRTACEPLGAMPTISMPLSTRFIRKVPIGVNWMEEGEVAGVKIWYHARRLLGIGGIAALDDLEADLLERLVTEGGMDEVSRLSPSSISGCAGDARRSGRACREAPPHEMAPAGLEHAVDLAVDVGTVGRVAARFDRVAVVKRVLERHLVEVGLHEPASIVEADLAHSAVAIHLVLLLQRRQFAR